MTIAIFAYKQRLLSLEMKTKLVQHVPRIIFNIYLAGNQLYDADDDDEVQKKALQFSPINSDF